jgi:TolB-like protein
VRSGLAGFLGEMKRRRLYRVAVGYLIVGAVIAGAVNDILPNLGTPEWVTRLAIAVLVLGFPASLVLAWALDWKPAVGSSSDLLRDIAGPTSGKKSCVVLPFDNLSPDPSDRYLGDGFAEEITAHLSKVSGLRVISRTSALALKGRGWTVPTVAREMGVQYVLEGSVRKAGSDLRVTAQLIDASGDAHLWAETYSGSVEDVFGMQEGVSLAVVGALHVELSAEEATQLAEQPFQSFQAYQFFVQARADAYVASEPALDRGLQTADLGLATVGENELLLVARGIVLFQYVNTMLKAPALHRGFLEEANRCADRALLLNPRSAPAHTLKGFVLWARGDMPGAVSQGTQALALDPNNPDALMQLGYWRAAGGWQPERAEALLRLLERVDPLTPLNSGALGWLHWFRGEFREALDRMQPWWEAMEEGNPWRVFQAYLQAAAGDVAAAAQTVGAMKARSPQHLLTRLGEFLLHAIRGKRDAAYAALNEDLKVAAKWDDAWPLFLADGHALIGDFDEAFRWLDQAVGQGITNVAYLREHDRFLAGLSEDPRFDATLAKAAEFATRAQAASTRIGL